MTSIAVVVPTRNRPKLAIQAIRSLLDQDCELDIFLSDNSSGPHGLAEFCRGLDRVTYLRPAEELPMPEHWDWAIRQAMERSRAAYFSIHYDRRISKPNHWGMLQAATERWPDRLVTFQSDHISHVPPPLRLWQPPWTGKYFRVRTARVARLVADGRFSAAGHALPVLSNCVVPRRLLDSIHARFGSVCKSDAPDSSFMARFFATDDEYVHHDRTHGIFHASRRSNGMGYLRGKGGDFADYVKLAGDRPWLPAAPLPGINLGQNILYHEYELVRRATGDRLPPLDREKVLADLGAHLRWVEDDEARAALRRMLEEKGWPGSDHPPLHRPNWRDWKNQLLCRYQMKRHGFVPPTITGFSFLSDRRALKYALAYPRQRQDDWKHLALLEPEAVE